VVRDASALTEAVDASSAALRQGHATSSGASDTAQLQSLATVTFLMAHAALRREESRGGHYRNDFPERDDVRWLHHCADVRPDS
jgi:succinate dehydrogenase/fumarate reductase flavoprotein subunit